MTEQEIFAKYPEIFKEKDLPMEQTCMCWGLEVPDSWLPVIDELCDAITHSRYIVSGPSGKVNFPQVVATQVKEKYGDLRFYFRLEYDCKDVPRHIYDQHYKYVDGMIAYAERKIYRMKDS